MLGLLVGLWNPELPIGTREFGKEEQGKGGFEVPLAEKTFYYSIGAGSWAAGRTSEP